MRKLYLNTENKVVHVSAFPETDLKPNEAGLLIFEGGAVRLETERTEGLDWGDVWTPPPPPPTEVETLEVKFQQARRDLLDTMKRTYNETLENLLPEVLTEEQALYIAQYGIHPVGYVLWQRSQWNGSVWVYPALPPYGVWECVSGNGFLKFEDDSAKPGIAGTEGGGSAGISVSTARWFGHVLDAPLYKIFDKFHLTLDSRSKDANYQYRNNTLVSHYCDVTSVTAVHGGGASAPPSKYRWKVWERKA